MGKLLIKLFIKDHKNVKDPAVRESYGKLAGIVGIISNLFLCSLKIIMGLISSSISIIADGINNLSDASSSIITLVGFRLASQPEDKNHPYGHARIEYLTGLFISIFIIIVGALLMKSSVEKIIHPQAVRFTVITILILVIAIFVKLWQTFFNRSIGQKIDSLTLKATATDSRNDVITTSVVLLGVLITKFSGIVVDGYLGVIVALFIIWSGIQLIRETSSPLLGEAPDHDLVKQIAQLSMAHEGVLGIHDLVVHNYGPGKIFASIHIEVDADGDLMDSHDTIDNLEKELSDALHIELVAHMDPIRVNDPLVHRLRDEVKSVISGMDGVVSMHDLRIVPGPTHTNIIFDLVISSSCELSEEEIHDRVEKEIRKTDPSYNVVITYDRAYTSLGSAS
jgi:cation diffusion facilitator family transporter